MHPHHTATSRLSSGRLSPSGLFGSWHLSTGSSTSASNPPIPMSTIVRNSQITKSHAGLFTPSPTSHTSNSSLVCQGWQSSCFNGLFMEFSLLPSLQEPTRPVQQSSSGLPLYPQSSPYPSLSSGAMSSSTRSTNVPCSNTSQKRRCLNVPTKPSRRSTRPESILAMRNYTDTITGTTQWLSWCSGLAGRSQSAGCKPYQEQPTSTTGTG